MSNRTTNRWLMRSTALTLVLAAGCAPKLVHRPTLSVPPAEWLKPGPQTEPNAKMRRLARRLRGADDLQTIRRVYQWVRAHKKRFRGFKTSVLRKRTAARLFRRRTLSGCGDWGVLLASLLRAAGLPTVFVEAMLKRWARGRQMGRGGTYMGHVFLEIKTKQGWVLLDSTKPYVWTGYDPRKKNLPRGYYVMVKGADPWAMGIGSQHALQWVMDDFADKVPFSAFREVKLKLHSLLDRMTVLALRPVVRGLRRKLRGVEVRGYAPRHFERWRFNCKKCHVLALLPETLSARERKAFYHAMDRYSKLPPLAQLTASTPRFFQLGQARMCLVVRRTTAELVRFGQRHGAQPVTAARCK